MSSSVTNDNTTLKMLYSPPHQILTEKTLESIRGHFNPEYQQYLREGKLEIFGMPNITLCSMNKDYMYSLITSNSGDHTGMKLWNPSKLLPLLILKGQNIIKPIIDAKWFDGQTVLEVGAGWAGLPGLACSRLHANKVILTDGEKIMVKSLELNATIERHNSGRNNISANLLKWGNEIDAHHILSSSCISSIDTVIGCDTMYTCPELLITTVSSHLRSRNILFCWEKRAHLQEEEDRVRSLLHEHGYIPYFSSDSIIRDLRNELPEGERYMCDEILHGLGSQSSQGLALGGDLSILCVTRPNRHSDSADQHCHQIDHAHR